MDRIFLRKPMPKIAVVLLSSVGNIMVFDERGSRIPEYCGENAKELRDKILEAAPENALFNIGCKQVEKKEFMRRI